MSDESKQPKARQHRWRKTTVVAILVLITHHSSLITATANGQSDLFQQPKEHYYKAKGQGIRVRWEVEPVAVAVGGELTATLVVTGAQNPAEVVKPDLRQLKSFDAFQITDGNDPPRDAKTKEVRFAYKLAPRNAAVREVPALKFHYFNPAAAETRRFPATVAESVPITVRDAPKTTHPIIPIEAPDFLFHPATGPDVLGRGPFVPCRWAWLAAALFGPLAAVGWFLAWRRVFPDAVRLAQMRRSCAARRATDAVRKSGRTPDPPATIANAVLGYLRTQFPLPEGAATPSEIAAALKELKVPADVAEQAADVFRACDRARFAPSSDDTGALAATAEAAISRLEALA